jgi:rod shape-determining protein MreD
MNNTFHIRDAVIGLVLLLVQLLIFQHLPILGSRPDLILVYLIWISTRATKLQTLMIAFISSFLLDAILDLWGLHMFSNSLLFLFGYEVIQNLSGRRFIFWQVFLLLSAIALIKVTIFLLLAGIASVYTVPPFTLITVVIGTFYTALTGALLDQLWKN